MAFPATNPSSPHNPFLSPANPFPTPSHFPNPTPNYVNPSPNPPPSYTPLSPPASQVPPPVHAPRAEPIPSAPPQSSAPVPTPGSSHWLPGSHAPPSGSHAPVSGGVDRGDFSTGTPPLITAAPVSYIKEGEGPTRAQWTPFPHSTIKELCKAQREFSRESEYFRGLLRASLLETNVVPADLRMLFSCLLNPTEFLVWEEAWKKGIRDILPDLWENTQTATTPSGEAVCTDLLVGLGNWADGATQARVTPRQALRESAKVAERAFLALKPAAPALTFSKICQGPDEPFIVFVERLRRAIDQQVQAESARLEILTEVANANANTACKAAILSLPLDPPPTIQKMIEVCQRKVPSILREDPGARTPTRRVSFAEAADLGGDVMAAQRTPAPPRRPSQGQCHLCGDPGHWMPDCPLRSQFYDFRRRQAASMAGSDNQQKN
ncbi:endogenous retrovirus group K member 113 Gag polyprotein-like [Motacilla alba alba]|uniref:endogenous retrovirus group K member 113 Gag polyprotein-like n=1 Tax=Motacilla alba alba TaxID=1094192 RepID=UPI0018D5337F|nr:endogenous retrovirus group K member 113 Gag polyprotein-like [Motacilla alba alba]